MLAELEPLIVVLCEIRRFVTQKMQMNVEAAVSAASRQMQAARLPLQNLFRREGGDDFLEARVTAKGVPKRQKFQLAVSDGSRWTDSDCELLAGEIFLTGPGSDHR